MTDYKSKIYEAAKAVLPELEKGDVAPADAFCDYCVPCFKFAKVYRKSPMVIAQEAAAKLKVDGMTVEALNGYLNFTIAREAVVADVFSSKPGEYKPLSDKTVCIDYSSVNIAKPFHIGHLMTTVIGGALYKMYRALGAYVVGINHLGDFGTQFGGLISAFRRWGSDEKLKERGLDELLELYVRYNKEAENDEEIAKEARAWSNKIESGDPYAVGLFERFKSITLEQAKKVYDRLNIEFDSYLGESFYVDKVAPVEDKLKAKNLLKISDGAEIVELENSEESGEKMPPALIRRSDGASLYIARDLAAAYYRHENYGFDKCLYVVASHQALHFKQLFKVLDLLGEPWAKDMVHVSYGMVSVEGMALSTRHGNVLFLNDVLNAAVEKALTIIEERNPALNDKATVAESVGVGAVVFDALYDGRLKDKNFSLQDALNFDGETGPYVQYTYARCKSVLAKAGKSGGKFDNKELTDDAAYEVAKLIADFDDVVYNAAVKYEPSFVSRRLVKICQAFNRFYNADRIMCGGSLQSARLALTSRVAETLKYGLSLILLDAPERM
ncbi:MAG: arginine--tRNA ligase [Clostridiales bacterium]|nr:arginine--tRNA ligase [Clostridiales bacterium]